MNQKLSSKYLIVFDVLQLTFRLFKTEQKGQSDNNSNYRKSSSKGRTSKRERPFTSNSSTTSKGFKVQPIIALQMRKKQKRMIFNDKKMGMTQSKQLKEEMKIDSGFDQVDVKNKTHQGKFLSNLTTS